MRLDIWANGEAVVPRWGFSTRGKNVREGEGLTMVFNILQSSNRRLPAYQSYVADDVVIDVK